MDFQLNEEQRILRDEVRRFAEERIRRIRIEHAGQLESEVVSAMDAGDFRRAERLLIDLIALGDMDTVVRQLRRRAGGQPRPKRHRRRSHRR